MHERVSNPVERPRETSHETPGAGSGTGPGPLAVAALFRCDQCGGALNGSADALVCRACGRRVPIERGLPRFVTSDTHENFSVQWKKFWDIQLDSRNGATTSRDRLLAQSHLSPEDFRGKLILEVGCGAGRFTELLLAFGARVVALDYSGAIDASAVTHAEAIAEGRLLVAQGDVFHLPVAPSAFDIVLGYGMLQHTGDARGALRCLWKHVRPGGLLLADRYGLSLRNYLPFKYALRPITSRLPPKDVLAYAERVCETLVPMQRRALRSLSGSSTLHRWARYVINRSPNSVYPLQLELEGKIDPDFALRWSVLDTFDQYAPKFDDPCTLRTWKRDLEALEDGEVVVAEACGQGNCAVVQKRQAPN